MATKRLEGKYQLRDEMIQQWLAEQVRCNENYVCEEVDGNDLESVSVCESSIIDSSSSELGEGDEQLLGDRTTNAPGRSQCADWPLSCNPPLYLDVAAITEQLKELSNSVSATQTIGSVNIANSANVHLGNIININGNLRINVRPSKQHQRPKHSDGNRTKGEDQNANKVAGEEDKQEEHVSSEVFIERLNCKIPKEVCAIVPRHRWLAQDPMADYRYLEEPVEYVVISHTATTSSNKQANNIGIIRDIQCFHIETRQWDDIAYNFLIGCDGNAYEGRGWGIVGAHTLGYNTRSVGISFIGCFMSKLPTPSALNTCKNLLKRGVDEGHLVANYKLVCHCQCTPTQSPGRKLFEEVQTWEHFYNIENENDECEN